MIPHISNEIKSRIRALDDGDVDIILCEIGGTVGDIEGLIFLEAIREIGLEVGRENAAYVHLTYVPYIKAAGEVKTKPSQQSVAKLREIGIMPDVLICRAEVPLTDEVRKKLSLFCNVPLQNVIEELDVEHSIYEVPIVLSEQGLDELLLVQFQKATPPADLQPWRDVIKAITDPQGEVTIGVVGKYQELQDAYKSIYEAIDHGGIAHNQKVNIVKIAAEDLEAGKLDAVKAVDGLLVPGGFGRRGLEGKVAAIRYARENDIPFFGICLGLQSAVIEFARHKAGLEKANSTEIDPDTPHPVVCLMEEQKGLEDLGATMRLGAWPCRLKDDTKSIAAYGQTDISERHRHRYEFNNAYRKAIEEAGMIFAGTHPEDKLVEVVEVPDHPWFVAVQYHPEFKSQPLVPHPLFKEFVGAAINNHRTRTQV